MITRCLLVLVLLLTSLSGQTSHATDVPVPEVWTARTAIKFALRSNPDSLIASQKILEAKAFQTKASAGFYPQVDLSGSYSQTDNPMYSFGNILNQGAFTPGIDFNNPGRTDDLNLRAGVEYRFYNGGQDQARTQAATAGMTAATAARESVHLRLEFEVIRSFQRIDEARNIQQARQATLAAIRSHLAVARARYEAGALLKVDLLNLQVEESRAEESLIQATHNLKLSKSIFLQLLGLNAGEVKIATTDADTPARPEQPDPFHRPELQQLQAATQAAEARQRAARGSRLPTVDGFAAYQYDQGYVLDGSGDSWLAGVKINFKLFDGHSTAADIAMAEAQLGVLRSEQRRLELAIGLEIMQAELALSQAEQRLQVTSRMVDQAAESAQLSAARFKQGALLATDLIDVETRLTDARVRDAAAKSAFLVAIADLRRASGLSQFEDAIKPPSPVEDQP